MKRNIVLLGVVFLTVTTVLGDALNEKKFQKPDREYGPMSWWHWINGNVTKNGIKNDLLAMHKNGMRGVQLFNAHMYLPKGEIEFGSDKWIEMVKYAIQLCDSLGMKFTTMNAAGWSGAGGPWITPESAMKQLVFSEKKIVGGNKQKVKLEKPKVIDGYYKDVALLALPAKYLPGQIDGLDCKIMMGNKLPIESLVNASRKGSVPIGEIINLSDEMDASGTLIWDVPKGDWTVIRFGYTLTGKKSHPTAWGGDGYECDKLDPQHVEFQFNQSLGKLFKATEKYLGNTFEGILFDSYEAHYQNWTGIVPDEFKKLNGYDLIPYLPLFTGRYVESPIKSERVLWDFRILLDNMIAHNYYGKMNELVHKFNLVVYAEGQGGPLSPSYVYDYVDIPMNEFWMPDTKPRVGSIRFTASMGSLQGKEIIGAEAFPSKPEDDKWQNTPWRMKKAGDLAFASGVNRYCLHSYAHQPLDHLVPGFTMGRYGTMFNRHLTWWNYAKEWFDYITRSQYMLQQGKTVTDIGFLFHDDIRNNFPKAMVSLPSGYDQHVIYPKNLMTAKVKGNYIELDNDVRFRLLILADKSKMNLQTLQKLSDLIKQGATVSGDAPTGIADQRDWSEESQAKFNRLVDEMWGGLDGKIKYVKSYGKGRIYKGKKTANLIELENLAPDVTWDKSISSDTLYYRHRKIERQDFYYLSSQSNRSLVTKLSFRVTGMVPELWNPVLGTTQEVSDFTTNGKMTTINYQFDPYGSVFVVFRKDSKGYKTKPMTSPVLTSNKEITGQWMVDFVDKKQKINAPVKFEKLSLWNENNDNRIKYYSGTAIYRNSFDLSLKEIKKANKMVLNLGPELYNIAQVIINGKDLGVVWAKPYEVDITHVIHSGENSIEIRVANTWVNRIIGDEFYEEDDAMYEIEGTKFTIGRASKFPSWAFGANEMPSDRKRVTYATWKHYDADSPLVNSGLVGPVVVGSYK